MNDLQQLSTSFTDARLQKRHFKSSLFRKICALVTWFGVALLTVLIYQVCVDGFKWLDIQFLTSFPSRFPYKAGIKSALVGTLWLISMIAFIAIPIGVATALYLEEFTAKSRIGRLIELNISNLAGVPSMSTVLSV